MKYFQIGIESLFHKGLSKIVEGQDLFVTKAVQSALIEVNERGTMAAAATGKVLYNKLIFCTSLLKKYWILNYIVLVFKFIYLLRYTHRRHIEVSFCRDGSI